MSLDSNVSESRTDGLSVVWGSEEYVWTFVRIETRSKFSETDYSKQIQFYVKFLMTGLTGGIDYQGSREKFSQAVVCVIYTLLTYFSLWIDDGVFYAEIKIKTQ
jgi:hypothetical protein